MLGASGLVLRDELGTSNVPPMMQVTFFVGILCVSNVPLGNRDKVHKMTFASELGMPNDSPVYPHLLVPFMFMAYDYLLTWDDEVKYVWMWSPKGSNHWLKWVPTTIYLMLRYFGTAFVFFSMIRTCLPPVPTGQWDPLLIGWIDSLSH
ncbi:hypothetical protein J3A83DRAFT_3800341 [Scleroderma citrinum]